MIPLLLACSGTFPNDTATPTENWPTLLGFIHHTTDETGIGGITVQSLEHSALQTTSAADGSWQLSVPPASYVTLRMTHPELLPVQVWISPLEAADPEMPYRMAMGDQAGLEQLYAALGEVRRDGKALVFVDALDVNMACIQNAPVETDAHYEAVWQEYAAGQWQPVSLTTAAGMDLMFMNVEPGNIAFKVKDPAGGQCEGPATITVVADEVTQVSFYCPYRQ